MNFSDLDLNNTYTYQDYYSWDFPERVELVNGIVYKMPVTSNRIHQEVLGNMLVQIGSFLEGKLIEIYAAPFDVRFPISSIEDKDILTVVQPDLCDM